VGVFWGGGGGFWGVGGLAAEDLAVAEETGPEAGPE
jgi:hypothetical protein